MPPNEKPEFLNENYEICVPFFERELNEVKDQADRFLAWFRLSDQQREDLTRVVNAIELFCGVEIHD